MNAILGLFNIIALLYIFRGLQLLLTIWRERSDWMHEPLTPRKKWLAEQASYFVAVPIGVFFHELAHALAIWAFGGQVVEFGYRFFWGYVVPAGSFTPTQDWIISFAGTFASLLYGVSVWLIFRHNRLTSLRYFGLRAFRFQIYFSLIYYPIFTLFSQIGDWRIIYGFDKTPLLSGMFMVIHAIVLWTFWQGDKRGVFEMPSHNTMAEQENFQKLHQATTANPDNLQYQVQYVDALRRGGAENSAKQFLQQLISQYPQSGLLYLELALLQSKGARPTRQTSEYAQKALQLGLPNPASEAYAHQLVGQYQLNTEQYTSAGAHFDQALGLLPKQPEQYRAQAQLFHLRSQVYRHQKQYERAYQDIQQAIKFAELTNDQQLLDFYQSELTVVETHAGRKMGSLPTELS